MPSPSTTSHLPPSHPARQQRPKSPNRVLAEAEAQWLFSEAELANTPSIQDGMTVSEERDIRAKGVNFILSVGVMLKLPQLTLSTAAIFFQRFLMRASLKRERNGVPKLHHYQTAATCLFLATKVEESCRKMKEMILAFCRVAQKNPNLIVDEQSKDWWRWRDCILHNEDVLLETLCFDLTVESPHRQLFDMLKYYGVEHNKPLRNAAWGFVTDSNNTQMCLLFSSRTIAAASLYAACRYCDLALPDDSKGRPWWEVQSVTLKDLRKAAEYMCANYEHAFGKVASSAGSQAPGESQAGSDGGAGERSIYVGLSTPSNGPDGEDSTRLRRDREQTHSPFPPRQDAGSERRASNDSSVAGTKRGRDGEVKTNGSGGLVNGVEKESKRPKLENGENGDGGFEAGRLDDKATSQAQGHDVNGSNDAKHEEEKLRVENGNERDREAAEAANAAATSQTNGQSNGIPPPPDVKAADGDEGSEEGEIEEE